MVVRSVYCIVHRCTYIGMCIGMCGTHTQRRRGAGARQGWTYVHTLQGQQYEYMMQAGVALQTSYIVCIRIRSNEHKYRDNEIPGTPTYPRSQRVSGLDMGVQYHLQLVVQVYPCTHQLQMDTTCYGQYHWQLLSLPPVLYKEQCIIALQWCIERSSHNTMVYRTRCTPYRCLWTTCIRVASLYVSNSTLHELTDVCMHHLMCYTCRCYCMHMSTHISAI